MTNTQGNRGWAAVMVAAIAMMLASAIDASAHTFSCFAASQADPMGQHSTTA